jgi:formylmethanofuran dehydrogenase subunit E
MTAKAEPDLAEVNRLIRAEHDRSAVTIDVEYALAALRSENTRLKETARADAEKAALNEKIHKKNSDDSRRENLRLQEQLLASQEKVYELQQIAGPAPDRERRVTMPPTNVMPARKSGCATPPELRPLVN